MACKHDWVVIKEIDFVQSIEYQSLSDDERKEALILLFKFLHIKSVEDLKSCSVIKRRVCLKCEECVDEIEKFWKVFEERQSEGRRRQELAIEIWERRSHDKDCMIGICSCTIGGSRR